MPIVNNSLTPYCPALPRMGWPAIRVPQSQVAPRAVELLRDNRAVVVSGQFRSKWDLNVQIGKSWAVEKRLIPALRKQGKAVTHENLRRIVEYRDFLNFRKFDYAPLARTARKMQKADVYVLDEVQYAIPFKEEMRIHKLRRKPYEGPMMALWDRLAEALEDGAKFVFVSCGHPHDPLYEGSMLSSTMALFFASPVLEIRTI